MIKRFATIDLRGGSAQTHASLSAARAILRFARVTQRRELMSIADKVFANYKAHGMTDHFANDNWFGRPRWTEGCAIIDSFDVAMLLWQAQGRGSATNGKTVALTTLQNLTAKVALPAGAMAFSVLTQFPFAGRTQVRISKAVAQASLQIFLPAFAPFATALWSWV